MHLMKRRVVMITSVGAGNVFGLAGSVDGSDHGPCQLAPLAQALLRQHLHLCAIWAGPGTYSATLPQAL